MKRKSTWVDSGSQNFTYRSLSSTALALAVSSIIGATQVQAVAPDFFSSGKNGNWSNLAVWDLGMLPTTDGIAYIREGGTVTVLEEDAAEVFRLAIESEGTTLQVVGGTMEVRDYLVVYAGGLLDISGGTVNAPQEVQIGQWGAGAQLVLRDTGVFNLHKYAGTTPRIVVGSSTAHHSPSCHWVCT